MPSPADAARLYDDSYFTASAHGGYADYVGDERVHRRDARRHLRRLRRLGAAPPGRLVDDMHVAIVSVLLGGGDRLFGDLGDGPPGYECVEFVPSASVVHVRLAPAKEPRPHH